MLAGIPPNATVQCSAVPAAPTVTSADVCDASPSLSQDVARVNGSCADSYVLLRTWASSDACGNTVHGVQAVTVLVRTALCILNAQDSAAPTIANVPPSASVSCEQFATLALTNASVADACDPAPAMDVATVRQQGSCPARFMVTRTWAAVDRCGNLATATQTITVDV